MMAWLTGNLPSPTFCKYAAMLCDTRRSEQANRHATHSQRSLNVSKTTRKLAAPIGRGQLGWKGTMSQGLNLATAKIERKLGGKDAATRQPGQLLFPDGTANRGGGAHLQV